MVTVVPLAKKEGKRRVENDAIKHEIENRIIEHIGVDLDEEAAD